MAGAGAERSGGGPLPAPTPAAPLAVPPGLRVPLVPDLFDGLVWAVVGQQVTFAHACTLRRRLVERCGTPLGEGLWAPPRQRPWPRCSRPTCAPWA
ncbi:hypothetical protein [Deinococcus multiflagellatus]|uniref:Uncharacterized protein n=1 Tax=Deinococcus multiflagellatus TaxID=1656887 RepID=A0ABW1ZMG7_9DEIO